MLEPLDMTELVKTKGANSIDSKRRCQQKWCACMAGRAAISVLSYVDDATDDKERDKSRRTVLWVRELPNVQLGEASWEADRVMASARDPLAGRRKRVRIDPGGEV